MDAASPISGASLPRKEVRGVPWDATLANDVRRWLFAPLPHPRRSRSVAATRANFYASAHETNSSPNTTKAAAAQVATISCPDVGQKPTSVPANAKSNIDTELATLDKQITEAYARLASSRQAQANDAGFVQNAILSPLKDKRTAVIGRIKIDFTRVGAAAPTTLEQLLATCTGTTADQAQTTAGGQERPAEQRGSEQRPAEQRWPAEQRRCLGQRGSERERAGQHRWPGRKRSRRRRLRRHHEGRGEHQAEPQGRRRLLGTFTTQCGVNANKNHDADNVIVAPGVTNGAHHLHDYEYGNQKVNAFSSNQTFLQGGNSYQTERPVLVLLAGRRVSRTARRTSTRTRTVVARKAT